MTDIEQARELLREAMSFVQRTHYDACRPVDVTEAQALSAIAAALRAAPEGFALVPAPKPCECHPETCACDSQFRRSQ